MTEQPYSDFGSCAFALLFILQHFYQEFGAGQGRAQFVADGQLSEILALDVDPVIGIALSDRSKT